MDDCEAIVSNLTVAFSPVWKEELHDGELGFDSGSLRLIAGGRVALAGNRIVGISPAEGVFLISEPRLMSNAFDPELAAQFVKFLSERGICSWSVPQRMKTKWFTSEAELRRHAWHRCVVPWVRAFLGTVPMALPDLIPSQPVWCVARLLVWRRQWQALRQILRPTAGPGLIGTVGDSLRVAARRWEMETALTVLRVERDGICDDWVRSEIAASDRLFASILTEFLPEYEFGSLTVARLL